MFGKSNAIMATVNRTNAMLRNDKRLVASYALHDVLKCDIMNVLKNYMNVIDDSVDLSIDVLNENNIQIKFSVKADRVMDFYSSK